MATRTPGVVREFLVDQPLQGLSKLYDNSLKAMLVCGLEFYLSASLVASFFQCPDETVQADQELQTLYTLAWLPIVLASIIVYGPKISSAIFPSPEHFERNMLRCKILTWMYAFALLIWEPDMIIKTGPSMGVSVLFCIADVGRFVMDMKHLTDVEYDENGNSFIVQDKTPRQSGQQQQQQEQQRHRQQQQRHRHRQQQQGHWQPPQPPHEPVEEENYTVQMIGAGDRAPSQRTGQNRQQGSVRLGSRPQQLQELPEQPARPPQGPSVPLIDVTYKLGSRTRQDLGLDKSPSVINSEYVAVLDRSTDKETAELIAKKSFTYEF